MVVEMRRERPHLHEPTDREFEHSRLGSTRHHDICPTCADHIQREAQRIGRGGAGRDDDLRRPLRPQGDGYVASRFIGYELRNGKRRKTIWPTVEQQLVALAGHIQPADSIAEKNTHTIHIRLVRLRKARIAPCLDRNRHRILREKRHVPSRPPVNKPRIDRVLLEALDLARNLARHP